MQCLIQPAINLSNQKPESIDGRFFFFLQAAALSGTYAPEIVIPFKTV